MVDKSDELEAVLEVLQQELTFQTEEFDEDNPTKVVKPPAAGELFAALWQVQELVEDMVGELARMYTLVDDLAAAQAVVEREQVSGLLGPDGRRI